jgi:hypothetical protein
VLALVFISCWHFMVWFAPSLVNVKELLFFIDETANWMLFAGFGYLLSVSVPGWTKEHFRFFLLHKKFVQAF